MAKFIQENNTFDEEVREDRKLDKIIMGICSIILLISIYNINFSKQAKYYNEKIPITVTILDKTNINKDRNAANTFRHIFLVEYPNKETKEMKVSPKMYNKFEVGDKAVFNLPRYTTILPKEDPIEDWHMCAILSGIIGLISLVIWFCDYTLNL